MKYDHLRLLRQTHPGWRLLAASHAPLIIGFLHRTFVEPNVRVLPEQDLAARLEDYLFTVRDEHQEDRYPKPALAYLKDWAADEQGWLRKFYPPDGDEAHFDITPATEKAIRWLVSLEQPRFVGAESRLKTVFDLLRQITEGVETDVEARLADLNRRKQALEHEIEETRAGRIDLLDDTRVRERFLQVEETAFGLLADFRQVDQNLKGLDRQVRERVARWEGSKGEVLDDVFGKHDAIADSDQGRSFRAFWDFLMSPARQDELAGLLEHVFQLDAVQALEPGPRLLRVHYDWLQAGELTQRTVAQLSAQLRRYLDDQAWLENRRIMELVRSIEQHALSVREAPPEWTMSIDEPAPRIELPMERPLFSIPVKPRITQQVLTTGDQDISTDALFEQVYVDRERLKRHIRHALQAHTQLSLGTLLAMHPLELGLSELVAYLALAAGDEHAAIDEAHVETVQWTDREGCTRRASIPTVLFTRGPA